MIFDWRQLIRDVVHDLRKGCRSGQIAAEFHRAALVQLLIDVAVLARKIWSRRVVLSGGSP